MLNIWNMDFYSYPFDCDPAFLHVKHMKHGHLLKYFDWDPAPLHVKHMKHGHLLRYFDWDPAFLHVKLMKHIHLLRLTTNMCFKRSKLSIYVYDHWYVDLTPFMSRLRRWGLKFNYISGNNPGYNVVRPSVPILKSLWKIQCRSLNNWNNFKWLIWGTWCVVFCWYKAIYLHTFLYMFYVGWTATGPGDITYNRQ